MAADTSLYRACYDGDAWSTAMNHLFDICHVLEHRDYSSRKNWARAMNALDSWQYRDSPVCAGPQSEWPESEYRRWSTPRLIATGKVLNRYLDLLKRHEQDY